MCDSAPFRWRYRGACSTAGVFRDDHGLCVVHRSRPGAGAHLRTQAAIRAATITPDQLFGDWTLLQEFEKPLCKLTLSNTSAGGTSYQIIVKPGCTASIAGFAPSTWRIEDNELVFAGRSGAWR